MINESVSKSADDRNKQDTANMYFNNDDIRYYKDEQKDVYIFIIKDNDKYYYIDNKADFTSLSILTENFKIDNSKLEKINLENRDATVNVILQKLFNYSNNPTRYTFDQFCEKLKDLKTFFNDNNSIIFNSSNKTDEYVRNFAANRQDDDSLALDSKNINFAKQDITDISSIEFKSDSDIISPADDFNNISPPLLIEDVEINEDVSNNANTRQQIRQDFAYDQSSNLDNNSFNTQESQPSSDKNILSRGSSVGSKSKQQDTTAQNNILELGFQKKSTLSTILESEQHTNLGDINFDTDVTFKSDFNSETNTEQEQSEPFEHEYGPLLVGDLPQNNTTLVTHQFYDKNDTQLDILNKDTENKIKTLLSQTKSNNPLSDGNIKNILNNTTKNSESDYGLFASVSVDDNGKQVFAPAKVGGNDDIDKLNGLYVKLTISDNAEWRYYIDKDNELGGAFYSVNKDGTKGDKIEEREYSKYITIAPIQTLEKGIVNEKQNTFQNILNSRPKDKTNSTMVHQ